MHWFLFLTLSLTLFAKTYQDPQGRFSLEFDEARWSVVPADKLKKGISEKLGETWLTIERTEAFDHYRPRFSIVAEELKETDFSQYQKKLVSFLEDLRFRVWKKELKTYSFASGQVFESTSDQRDFGLTMRHTVFIWEKKAMLLTSATRIARWAEDEKEFQTIAASFKLGTAPEVRKQAR